MDVILTDVCSLKHQNQEFRILIVFSDIFLPCPDTLLVNMNESKERVIDLLNLLPNMFEGNMETGTALGAALQAGFKMTVSCTMQAHHYLC